MSFLLDSSILIEAKNRTPIDVFPTFWSKLQEQIVAGNIVSSIKVKDELQRGNEDDELVSWIETLPDSSFLQIDNATMLKYAQVINWAEQNPQYNQAAKAEFANSDIADAFLIATALSQNHTIVTNEISEPNRHNKVKIPDAAYAMSVSCCNLIDMLRSLHVII